MMISCNNLSFFFFLPQDVINEILLKLPVKSLMKLRCVSKYFFNLITSPSFVYQHLHYSTSQSNNHLVLISSSQYHLNLNKQVIHRYSCKFSDNNDPSCPDLIDTHFPFEFASVQFSCNGLLYLHLGSNTDCIWNPCTKEYKELFRPHIKFPMLEKGGRSFLEGFCGFGYDRANDVYRILYYGCRKAVVKENYYLDDYCDRGITFLTEFKVCTLGRITDTWRNINSYDNRYSSLGFGRWRSIGLPVNGVLHWLMSSKDSSTCRTAKAKIISFDIEKEEFGEIQKPQSIPEEVEDYEDLQVLQGCLCICQVLQGSDEDMDIWMLKDYAVKDSWTKLFTILVQDHSLLTSIRNNLKLLRLCKNGEIVVFREAYTVIVYDPINCKARHVENIEAIKRFSVHEMTYVESLVSLNTGVYRG